MGLCKIAASPWGRRLVLGVCAGGVLMSDGCRPAELQEPTQSPPTKMEMAAVPTSGLIGEWKLDEAGGTTAVDSKNGYNASVLGGAGFVPGRLGNSLDLNNGTAGTGGKYAQMPSNSTLDDVQEGNYTISAWFYAYSAPTDATVDNRNWAIVVKYGHHMGLVYEVGQTFSARHYLTGNIFKAARSASTYPLNTWHHVAQVVSKTAGTIKIYVNGALTGMETFDSNTLSRDYGTTPFRIGRAQSYWAADGKVDQVRIYNRDLSDAEVADLYNESSDNTPPTISAVVSAPASDKSAVMWATNEASNSSVDYGPTSGYGSTTPVQSDPVTSHTVLLTGLAPQQVYHYRVRSTDAGGNTSLSGDRTFSTSPSGTLASFPGAQGGGATGTGGRGGVIIPVTNLNDAGGGSLRACMQASGPRTCVFRLGGTINLQSAIFICSTCGNLTVAGQTAPGGGILLKGKAHTQNQVTIKAPDVVLQYLRIRAGYNPQREPGTGGGVPLDISDGAVRIVADHMSLSWNADDNSQAFDHQAAGEPRDLSLSYLLIAEGLQGQSTGFTTGSALHDAGASLMTNIDLHHSMFSNHTHRTPMLKVKSSRVVNNILYNNDFASTQLKGGLDVDLIGNVYKKGPYNQDNPHEIIATTAGSQGNAVTGSPSIYLQGNKGWSQPSPAGDQWLLAAQASGDNGPETGTIPSAWRRGSPLPTAGVPIVADPADNLESILTGSNGVGASARLDCNGNWVPNRDAVDTRLMNQYAAGTGTYPGPPSYEDGANYGWPTMASGTPCPDADNDGMPDAWEIANGLKPNDPADRNAAAANGSGYTNLDMYLAGMRAR
jgi:pectate lyase